MDATLGTLLDRLQGFLGKAYFLAGFLPMVVFLTLNALLAALVFPDAAQLLQGLTRFDVAENALTWLGLLLLAYVLGLLVWSLNPTIRQILEGRYLPGRARRWLAGMQRRELETLRRHRRQAGAQAFDFRRVTIGDDRWRDKLVTARREGRQQPPGKISMELVKLSTEVQGRREVEKLDFATMKQLFCLLEAELKAKPADVIGQLDQLDQLQQDFLELLEFACQSAEAVLIQYDSELGIRFPKSTTVGPTRLANQTEVQREYGLRRYGLDIELYWLRLQKVARGDERYFPILEDAKTQLDFSVTTVALLTLMTAAWVPLSLVYAATPLLFLLLGVVGPLSIWLFSHVVNQNYRAFAEAVRSAVDLYRFDLLTALHLPLPTDSDAEKRVWSELMGQTVGRSATVLAYLHPSPDKDEGGQDEQPEQANP